MASTKMSFYVLFILVSVAIQLSEFGVEADLGGRHRTLQQLGVNNGYQLVGCVFGRRSLMQPPISEFENFLVQVIVYFW